MKLVTSEVWCSRVSRDCFCPQPKRIPKAGIAMTSRGSYFTYRSCRLHRLNIGKEIIFCFPALQAGGVSMESNDTSGVRLASINMEIAI